MQISVRSYLTAGVALVGASAIALTPVTAIPTPAHTNPLRVVAVELTATQLDNPFTVFAPVVDQLIKSTHTLAEGVLANPAPILKAILLNQVDTAATLAGVGNAAAETLGTALFTLPQTLDKVADQLQKGQLANAYSTLLMAALMPVVNLMLKAMPKLVPMITQPFAQTKAAIEVGIETGMMSVIGVVPLLAQAPPIFLRGVEAAIKSLRAGDPVAAVNSLMKSSAASAKLTVQFVGTILQGVLVRTPLAIANAVRPPAPNPAAAVEAAPTGDAVASLPSADARMVSLRVDSASEEDAAGQAPAKETSGDAVTAIAEGPETETALDSAGINETEGLDETVGADVEGSEESESPNGSTDLSGGNKAEPGKTGSDTDNGAGSGSGSTDELDGADTGTIGTNSGTGSTDNGVGDSHDDSDGGSDS